MVEVAGPLQPHVSDGTIPYQEGVGVTLGWSVPPRGHSTAEVLAQRASSQQPLPICKSLSERVRVSAHPLKISSLPAVTMGRNPCRRGISAHGSPCEPLPRGASRARIPAMVLLATCQLGGYHAGAGMGLSPPLFFIFWAAKPLCSPEWPLALLCEACWGESCWQRYCGKKLQGKPRFMQFGCNAVLISS